MVGDEEIRNYGVQRPRPMPSRRERDTPKTRSTGRKARVLVFRTFGYSCNFLVGAVVVYLLTFSVEGIIKYEVKYTLHYFVFVTL